MSMPPPYPLWADDGHPAGDPPEDEFATARDVGRIAALRIRAGKRNWEDAEALAEAFEVITRPR